MSEILPIVAQLVAAADTTEHAQSLQPLLQALHTASDQATPAELDAAVVRLSAALDLEYAQAYGELALAAGALVEAGADPAPLTARLLQLLPELLQRAWAFAQSALAATLSANRSEAVDEATAQAGLWLGDRLLPEAQVDAMHASNPDGLDAWLALDCWCLPTIACLSRDPVARCGFNWERLRELGELSSDVRCLWLLTQVPEHESFLVLHPASNQGFHLRVSGVADNFQLHTLLAATLIPPLPGKRPSSEAIAVASGTGPQQGKGGCQGVWDLYQWTALDAQGQLPDKVPSRHWIWGEGKPADIARFKQQRVILIAEPSYSRGWENSRFFAGLPASVEVKEVLSPELVSECLRSMGNAAATRNDVVE